MDGHSIHRQMSFIQRMNSFKYALKTYTAERHAGSELRPPFHDNLPATQAAPKELSQSRSLWPKMHPLSPPAALKNELLQDIGTSQKI